MYFQSKVSRDEWEKAFAKHILDACMREFDQKLIDFGQSMEEDDSTAEDVLSKLLVDSDSDVNKDINEGNGKLQVYSLP